MKLVYKIFIVIGIIHLLVGIFRGFYPENKIKQRAEEAVMERKEARQLIADSAKSLSKEKTIETTEGPKSPRYLFIKTWHHMDERLGLGLRL